MGGNRAPLQLNPNPSAENDTLFAPKILLFYKKTEKDNKALARSVKYASAEIDELKEQVNDLASQVSGQRSSIKDQGNELDTKIANLDLQIR